MDGASDTFRDWPYSSRLRSARDGLNCVSGRDAMELLNNESPGTPGQTAASSTPPRLGFEDRSTGLLVFGVFEISHPGIGPGTGSR